MHPKDVSIPGAARGRRVFQLVRFILIVLAIVLPIRYFIAQPFIVSGVSMVPTFDPNEYLVIDQISERSQKPHRGDVIIFKYPLDPSTYFIKRVIGLPGETVYLRGTTVTIGKEGTESFQLNEPYQHAQKQEGESMVVLADDEYFVLGDNRDASADSRIWGPLKERYIVGRPIVRLFPFAEIEQDPGVHEFSDTR